MRIKLGLAIAAAFALGIAGGCDDPDNGDTGAATKHHRSGSATARLGLGWHAPGDNRLSIWAFRHTTSPVAAENAGGDTTDSVSLALHERMLPSRDSVRIADMIGRVTGLVAPAGPMDDAPAPRVVLSTTPWNDDTLLLWVEVPGRVAAAGATISVEFDPKTVAGYRPLGDPGSLPLPDAEVGRAAMLYELTAIQDDHPRPDRHYATLHIGAGKADPRPVPYKLDRPVTEADFIESIDDVPDIVRVAAAAAGFAQLLRGDPAVRDLSCHDMINLAESVGGPDPDGQRSRLIDLMHRAEPLIDLPPSDAPPAPSPTDPAK
jgi:hypothetical protein